MSWISSIDNGCSFSSFISTLILLTVTPFPLLQSRPSPSHSPTLRCTPSPAILLQARRKIANKNALDDITERTGVAIISRGQFIPAGRKIEGSERRLHLLIEGNSEMSVRQARLDILRVLEEETLRISSSTSLLGSAGRYSVL